MCKKANGFQTKKQIDKEKVKKMPKRPNGEWVKDQTAIGFHAKKQIDKVKVKKHQTPNLDKLEPKRRKNKKFNFLFFLWNLYLSYVTASSEKYIAKVF